MSYTALYRKLRPQRFGEVVGQEPIVRTLQNQIKTDRITHAYLFCGTRGTGKTSTAKIFAKAINCENPLEGEPCGQCRVCEDIRQQISLNVIEIDAASNNGVDNIRDIREEVKYPPTEGRYKIYIIDEVHMLSTGAFNALLKTLEEPPDHVIFILATTDPQKIPPTILSRCQRFDFRRITTATMVEKMRTYLSEENIEASEDALQYIARISDGAMRDALSLLDQCLSFYFGQAITLEMIVELVGSVDDSIFYSLSEALNSFDSAACLSIIEEIIMKGRDVSQFVGEFVSHIRNMLVAVTIGGAGSIVQGGSVLDLSEDNINRLRERGGAIEKERLIAYINAFSLLNGQLKYASNPRIQLEVCCIQLCNPTDSDEYYAALSSRIKKLENEITNIGSAAHGPASSFKEAPAQPEPVQSPSLPQKPAYKAVDKDIDSVIKDWSRFIKNFTNMDNAILSLSTPQYMDGQFYLVCNDPSSLLRLRQKEELIKEKLLSAYGREFQIQFISREEYNSRHKNIYGSEDEEFNKHVEELNRKIRTEIVIE